MYVHTFLIQFHVLRSSRRNAEGALLIASVDARCARGVYAGQYGVRSPGDNAQTVLEQVYGALVPLIAVLPSPFSTSDVITCHSQRKSAAVDSVVNTASILSRISGCSDQFARTRCSRPSEAVTIALTFQSWQTPRLTNTLQSEEEQLCSISVHDESNYLPNPQRYTYIHRQCV